MVLSFLILATILFVLIKDYKYGVILVVALNIWLDLFSIYGSNILTYSSLFVTILFFCKRRFKINLRTMPASISIVLLAASFLITGFFAESPNILPAILNTIRESIMMIVFYHVFITDPQRLSVFFIKVTGVFSIAFILVAIIELITSTNYYIHFVNSIDAYRVDTYIDTIRYGIKRCQSVFSMHTTLGGAALLTCIPMAWYFYSINRYHYGKYVFLFSLIAVFCAYASGARSTIIGSVLAITMFINIKDIISKNGVFLLCILTCIFILFYDEIEMVIDSIINNDSIGGSDESMRREQLAISLYYLNKNLLIGNGVYAWTEVTKKTDLLGAESIWFGLMIDRGLIGILYLILFNMQLLWYVYKQRAILISFFIIAFLVVYSLSSLPNIIYSYIYVPIIIMVYIYRKYQLNLD